MCALRAPLVLHGSQPSEKGLDCATGIQVDNQHVMVPFLRAKRSIREPVLLLSSRMWRLSPSLEKGLNKIIIFKQTSLAHPNSLVALGFSLNSLLIHRHGPVSYSTPILFSLIDSF
jgi:hypothetical protein